jgi:DNA-binding transcriptional LysR family regulator
MERLDDLEAFLAIIEKGSQAAASRHLQRPLQSLNRSLMALERAMGVELVKRATRRSEPTEAGRVLPAHQAGRRGNHRSAQRSRQYSRRGIGPAEAGAGSWTSWRAA